MKLVIVALCLINEICGYRLIEDALKKSHPLLSSFEPDDLFVLQIIDDARFRGILPERGPCEDDHDAFCVKWGEEGVLKISGSHGGQCRFMELRPKVQTEAVVVAFKVAGHLYGGSEQALQLWPVENQNFTNYSFVSKQEDGQAVLEPYWLHSKGSYLYVDKTVPLFISITEDGKLFHLIANNVDPYRKMENVLKYTICKLGNVTEAHLHAVNNFLGKPKGIPDVRMIQHPVWSTWAKYKANINETVVMEYARAIKAHNFSNSQLEIDDNWETCYGSLTPNAAKFPNMKKIVDDLHQMGFRVTFWVHPFVNENCTSFHEEGEKSGYFVMNGIRSTKTKWWNGNASYIDFTNPEAVKWYTNRLKKLQADTGVDSFKFDAGESSWSPQIPYFNHSDDGDHPETILKAYVAVAAQFGGMVEVRSARGTQEHPIYVRMMDRESTWSQKLGLPSMVTTLLQMNTIGYPFVLPDMIGGNGYNNKTVSGELFLRWLQCNVFMPVLQFSYPPWDYDQTVVDLAKKFVDLHYQYSGLIAGLMKKAVVDGTPVNLPLWWFYPHDRIALTIDDEFFLGSDILVAPVLVKGEKGRTIYLPSGRWMDVRGDVYQGPILLAYYEADLDTLPYFEKVNAAPNLVPFISLISASIFAVLHY